METIKQLNKALNRATKKINQYGYEFINAKINEINWDEETLYYVQFKIKATKPKTFTLVNLLVDVYPKKVEIVEFWDQGV